MPDWATCCVICLFIKGAKWKDQQTDVQTERQIDGWMEGIFLELTNVIARDKQLTIKLARVYQRGNSKHVKMT